MKKKIISEPTVPIYIKVIPIQRYIIQSLLKLPFLKKVGIKA